MSLPSANCRPPSGAISRFRDFGGRAGLGGLVRRDMLFRSGHLARATDEDLEWLAGLGVRIIVDLRQPYERAQHPPCRFARPPREVIFAQGGVRRDPWMRALARITPDAAFFRADLVRLYRRMVAAPRYRALFSRYFAALDQASRQGHGVLVHCSAGKDRTGFLCALTQRLLGVGEHDVFDDYLAANDEPGLEARIDAFQGLLASLGVCPVDEAALRAALMVEPDYLQAAFDEINARWGSLEAYFTLGLRIGEDRLDRIRRALVS